MYILKINLLTYDQKNFKSFENKINHENIKFIKTLNLKKLSLNNIIKNFVILKSPHVNKKSLEHFQYKLYKKTYIFSYHKILPLLFFNFLIFQKFSSNFKIKSKISSK